MELVSKIKSIPLLKQWGLWLLKPSYDHRPRWWIRNLVNPFFHHRGKGSKVRRSVRLDVFPSKAFYLGEHTIVEDFATINNGVGDVFVGNHDIIGLGTVIIGPVEIGNEVLLAQHIVVSGLNHGYQLPGIPPRLQPDIAKPVVIEDEVWIGANSVVVAGVHIGKHSVIAAGSVVVKDVPSYCVVAGNPARVIKKMNTKTGIWERVLVEDY